MIFAPFAKLFVRYSWLFWLGAASVGIVALFSPVAFRTNDSAIWWTALLAVGWWNIWAVVRTEIPPAFAGLFAPFFRVIYTQALLLYLIHVAVAFHRGHGWSHGAALDHVEKASGFGEGLFVSYGFTLLWIADAAWAWWNLPSYADRPSWVNWMVYGFMVFIIFNATVVFGKDSMRWYGALMFFSLGYDLLRRRRSDNGNKELSPNTAIES